MRRVVAYVKRFLNNTGTKKEERLTGPPTVQELRSAQNYLVKRAHGESFGEEVQLLEKGREIHKRSRINSLDPRLEDGYLVVGERLPKFQAIPYCTRRSPALANFFWRSFTKEYLTSLMGRKKVKENRQNMKVGDVVLLSKPNQQRGIWPLGRVMSTHSGQDGRVRAATLRTRSREFRRPITKFCLLEEANLFL